MRRSTLLELSGMELHEVAHVRRCFAGELAHGVRHSVVTPLPGQLGHGREMADEVLRKPRLPKAFVPRREWIKAGEEWDTETGLTALRNRCDAAWAAMRAAEEHLAQVYPTTPAGAAAFLRVALKDMETGDAPWQEEALATIASALSTMGNLTHTGATI